MTEGNPPVIFENLFLYSCCLQDFLVFSHQEEEGIFFCTSSCEETKKKKKKNPSGTFMRNDGFFFFFRLTMMKYGEVHRAFFFFIMLYDKSTNGYDGRREIKERTCGSEMPLSAHYFTSVAITCRTCKSKSKCVPSNPCMR